MVVGRCGDARLAKPAVRRQDGRDCESAALPVAAFSESHPPCRHSGLRPARVALRRSSIRGRPLMNGEEPPFGLLFLVLVSGPGPSVEAGCHNQIANW
jgi:hypothetical protein